MDLTPDREFVDDEHKIWYGVFALLAGAFFAGIGFFSLNFGLGTGNDVAAILAFIFTVYVDLNALAFFASGVYVGYSGVRGYLSR